mmetsp:Transcript_3273/g.8474  ORF Transcript_3273/g.8474 Transcript_3273/m.8474 type:complete len:224 (-) Transcript_3273:246-917(-)
MSWQRLHPAVPQKTCTRTSSRPSTGPTAVAAASASEGAMLEEADASGAAAAALSPTTPPHAARWRFAGGAPEGSDAAGCGASACVAWTGSCLTFGALRRLHNSCAARNAGTRRENTRYSPGPDITMANCARPSRHGPPRKWATCGSNVSSAPKALRTAFSKRSRPFGWRRVLETSTGIVRLTASMLSSPLSPLSSGSSLKVQGACSARIAARFASMLRDCQPH